MTLLRSMRIHFKKSCMPLNQNKDVIWIYCLEKCLGFERNPYMCFLMNYYSTECDILQLKNKVLCPLVPCIGYTVLKLSCRSLAFIFLYWSSSSFSSKFKKQNTAWKQNCWAEKVKPPWIKNTFSHHGHCAFFSSGILIPCARSIKSLKRALQEQKSH